MTGRLNIFATVLSEHRLHVARCTCLAWDADLTLDARSVRIEEQHRLHVAAALDAVLAAQEGDLGEGWPCDNYNAPTTCLTAPSTITARCGFCNSQAEAATP